jgi:hypothetical protein
MLRRIFAGVAVAGLIAAMPAAALALRSPDQEQSTGNLQAIAWGVSTAQTFTPAHSGVLDTVSIDVSAYSSGHSNEQVVTILATSAGMPTGTPLASETLTVVGGWNDILFTSPATVVAGTLYAIVVTPTYGHDWHYTCDPGVYTRGQALILDSTWKTIPTYVTDHALDVSTYCVKDFTFKAYVTADDLSVQFTLSRYSVPVSATTTLGIDIAVTNNGSTATSNHVVITVLTPASWPALTFGAVGCTPSVCTYASSKIDMQIIGAGATVHYGDTGGFDSTGIPDGTTITNTIEVCVENGIPDVIAPNGAGVLQSNGCWDATVNLVVGTAASPSIVASPSRAATPPPTSASAHDSGGGSALPLALLLVAIAGLSSGLLVFGTRRR